jgi:hypothetical protein
VQSASKNSQPRAWRPLLSVNSEVSEIMVVHHGVATSHFENFPALLSRLFCGRCLAA